MVLYLHIFHHAVVKGEEDRGKFDLPYIKYFELFLVLDTNNQKNIF